MKVLAISGSGRRNGNTKKMIERLFGPLHSEGIETELLQLAGKSLEGCRACYKCFKVKDGHCHGPKDDMNAHIDAMREADAIVLASPVYFATVTAHMKALIDRAGLVGMANGSMFRRKVGAAVTVARRGGAIHTFDALNHFFFISQMVVPGSSYWNMGFAGEKGAVVNDSEAMETMDTLGENMAWLLKKLA